MSDVALQFLRTFKALPAEDQRAVLLQLLREPVELEYPPPADSDLIAAAELVFLEYDKAESAS